MEDKEKQIEAMAKYKAILVLDMPNTCSECLFLDDNGDYPFCTVTGETRGYNFRTRELKMDKCPLRELPEDSVVISKEEYQTLFENKLVTTQTKVDEELAEQARKEKAERDNAIKVAKAIFAKQCGAEIKG